MYLIKDNSNQSFLFKIFAKHYMHEKKRDFISFSSKKRKKETHACVSTIKNNTWTVKYVLCALTVYIS